MDETANKEETVQRMFSSIARTYDLNNTLLSLGRHHAWKEYAVSRLGIRAGDRLIDICAGTTDLAIRMAVAAGDGGSVTAVDLNLEMLEAGRRKVERAGLDSRIRLVRGNAESIEAADHEYDGAIVGFGIRNVADIPRALSEMCRVIKPGRRAVCLEFSRPVVAPLRLAYDFYSFTLLPLIGRLVSGDRTGVYQYLPESIRRFPDQETLKEMMLQAGFSDVSYTNLSGGIVAVHVGIK